MTTYYIGADVHSNSTELVIQKSNKIVASYSVPTTIPAISNILDSLQGRKHLTFEEGPMAGWLYRNLSEKVDRIVVCDPRPNKLISADGDSDDKIDAGKLALLQARMAKCQLSALGKRHEIIKLWDRLPGIGIIRAATLFAYLDTPWRFKKKNKLWKYCGVGLQRTASGTDKKGRPKPARLQLLWAANRKLKNAVLGAAISAINQKDNVFKDYYERMVQGGVLTSNARHAVARKMLSVIWGMWKTNSQFDERLLCSLSDHNRPTASIMSR